MDDFDRGSSSDATPERKKQSTFWMKRLQEAEEQDPER